MHFDATLVAGLAFLTFIGLLIFLGLPKMIATALDGQSKAIADELAAAKKLRVQAEELRQSYEAQSANAAAEAKELIKQAKLDAKNLKAQAAIALEADIATKTKNASARIERAEQLAIAEVRALAADQAIEQAKAMLSSSASGKGGEALLKASLANITSELAN